jgi:pyridoxal biosynthesis lyase PdxS
LKPEVAFTVASNVIMTNGIAEKIRKAYKQVEGFKKYSEARKVVIEECGGVDMGNGSFKVENAEGLTEKLVELSVEHKDVVESQESYDKNFNEAMEGIEEADLKPITLDDLAGCDIDGAGMKVLIEAGLISDGSNS